MPASEVEVKAVKDIAAAIELTEEEEAAAWKKKILAELEKVKVLRSSSHSLRRIYDSNPNFIFVWINKDPDRRIWFESLGYTKATVEDCRTDWQAENGEHRVGDIILYKVPRERYEALKLDSQLRSVEAIETAKSEFLDFAARNSVPARRMK